MTTLVSFFVHGRPAPQGSKRHVGNGIMIESSKRVAPWREAVKHAFLASGVSATRYEGPVRVTISFNFEPPKSAPKRKRIWPDTRSSGDIDKLLRSTFDALVDVGVIRDDAQIVRVDAEKDYVGLPGASIRIDTLLPVEASA